MKYLNRTLTMTIFLVVLLFFTSCSPTDKGASADLISGTAYAKTADGTIINWYEDTGNSYSLDETGKLIIYYGNENDENTRTATLPLSIPLDDIGLTNAGIYIAKEKTAFAYKEHSASPSMTVLSSDDRGETWSTTTIKLEDQAASWAYIGFSTSNNGWLIACAPAQDGKEKHYLYLTADGGKTWNYIDNDINKKYNKKLYGAGFIDDKVGFMCFSAQTEFDPAASFTNDGGYTWYSLYISTPKEYNAYNKTTLSPIFDGKNVLMPILLTGNNHSMEMILMKSSNYGRTWHTETSKKIRMKIDVNEYCDI